MWWRQLLEIDGLDLLIERQGGVVSRSQLLAGGWTDARVKRGLRARRWQTVHPGVYSIHSGKLGYDERILAGLLYAGADAMWSHYTAAEQQGLIAIDQDRSVYVTVPHLRRLRAQPGLVVHRTRRYGDRLHTVIPPWCAPAHALVDVIDLAETLDDAAALVARAFQTGKVSVAEISAALVGRRVRHRDDLAPLLRDVAAGSHSALELRYLRDVERRHGLPAGDRQRAVDGEFTDVAYERHGVVVELDGRLHLDPRQRWRDMGRDNRAALRSERSLRYGWTDVASHPCQVAAQVLVALRLSGVPDDASPCGADCPVRATNVSEGGVQDSHRSLGR